jgi:hypothetical protein
MKLYKMQVALTNAKGDILRTVPGKCLGLLAVTPTDDRPSSRRRNITHIPTGFKLCPTFDNQQQALEALPKWVDAADWNFSKVQTISDDGFSHRVTPEVQAAWEAVKAAGLR